MLLATGLTGYLSSVGWYSKAYVFLPDTLGYSIFTNIAFMFLYWRPKFCIPTKLAVLGLLLMNIVSLVLKGYEMATGIDFYNTIYDVYITVFIFLVALFFKFNRF